MKDNGIADYRVFLCLGLLTTAVVLVFFGYHGGSHPRPLQAASACIILAMAALYLPRSSGEKSRFNARRSKMSGVGETAGLRMRSVSSGTKVGR